MKWNWSLKKLAAEEIVQPTPPLPPQPQVPMQPKAEPALTPMVQNPPVAHPIMQQAQPGESFNELMADKKRIERLTNFVNRNLHETDDHAGMVLKQYRASADLWKFFQTIAQPIVEQAGKESFDQFVQRCEAKGDNSALNAIEQAKQEAGFVENDQDENTANSLLKPALENLEVKGNDMMSSWIQKIISSESGKSPQDQSTESKGIAGAINNFLFGKGLGNAVKWKTFFKNHSEFIPKDVRKRLKNTGSIYKAINQSVYEWYKSGMGDDELHPCLQKLEDLMLEHSPELQKALLECARSIGTNKGQSGISHSNTIGDKQQSMSGNIAGKDIVDPAAADPKFSADDKVTGEQIIDTFLDRHPDFMEKLRLATYPGENVPMTQAIVQQAQQKGGKEAPADLGKAVDELLNQVLRYPVMGVVYEKLEDGSESTIPEYNKWNDFFFKFDDLLPQMEDLNADTLQENSTKLMPIMMTPQAQASFDDYMGDPAKQYGECYNYLKKLYEQTLNKYGAIRTFMPGVGDIKQISRLGKMATGALFREFQVRKATSKVASKPASSARGYALLKAKNKAITKLLLRLANTKDVIPVTKDLYIFTNNNGEIIMKKKVAGPKGSKKPEFRNSKLTDETFHVLADAVSSNWVNDAYDIILGNDKEKGQIAFPAALARKEGPAGQKEKMLKDYPLGQAFMQADMDYLKANPKTKDRHAGWRLHLSQLLNQKAQELGQRIGQQITPEVIAERVQRVKSEKNSARRGARLSEGVESIKKLFSGQPTGYDKNTFTLLADALSTFPGEGGEPVKLTKENIFAPTAHEYDKYSYDDRTDLMGLVPALLSQYGPYLVHRKRDALRRGQREDLFNDRSLWCFLNLVGTRKFIGEEEKKIGWYAHELSGGTPLDPADSAQQIEENLSRKLISPKGVEPKQYAPLGRPDPYNDIEFRKNKKMYFPDPNHPLGFQEQNAAHNDSKILREVQKAIQEDPSSEFKTIDEYKANAVKRWTEAVNDNRAQVLENQLAQQQSPIQIAKELLKSYNPEGDPTQELEKRMNDYNELLKGGGFNKTYDIDQYAQKMVNDTIANIKLTQEGARQGLEKLKALGDKPHPFELAKLVLPSLVKNRLVLKKFNREGVEKEDKTHIQGLANSKKPEELQELLATKPPLEVAKSIFTGKGMDDARAMAQLDKKMRLYNRKAEEANKKTPEQPKPIYKTLDEYAKHYVDEVVRLETYYRQVAKERLEQINKGDKRDIDFPRFSSTIDKLMKYSMELSKLAERQMDMMEYGHSEAFLRLADIIADKAHRELNG